MSKEQFIGAWKLISFELRTSDGQVSYPIGSHPAGMLMYDAQGHMSGQIMRPNRQAFASDDHLRGIPEEVASAFEGYMAYCGTYDVNEADQTVTHRLECSLFPNWIGTAQTRYFEFSGDQLLLWTPPMTLGGVQQVAYATWRRAS